MNFTCMKTLIHHVCLVVKWLEYGWVDWYTILFYTEPSFYPTGLRLKSIRRTSAVAHWNPLQKCLTNMDILGFTIFLQSNNTGLLSTMYVAGANGKSYKLYGLTPQTTYNLRIAAVNSEGLGPYSPGIIFETKWRQRCRKCSLNCTELN